MAQNPEYPLHKLRSELEERHGGADKLPPVLRRLFSGLLLRKWFDPMPGVHVSRPNSGQEVSTKFYWMQENGSLELRVVASQQNPEGDVEWHAHFYGETPFGGQGGEYTSIGSEFWVLLGRLRDPEALKYKHLNRAVAANMKRFIVEEIFRRWTRPGEDQQRLGQLLFNALASPPNDSREQMFQRVGERLVNIEDFSLLEAVLHPKR